MPMSDVDSTCDPELLRLSEDSLCFNNDLPDELWMKVWEYLGYDDLLVSSRVCRRWKSFISAYPQLWREFRITSPHDGLTGFLALDAPGDCYVFPASVSRQLALEVPGMPSSSVFSTVTLAALLGCSTSRTLSIGVVLHSDVSTKFIWDLAQTLLPHIARVHELRIFHTTPSPVLRLLSDLVPMAAIRELCLYTPADIGRSCGWAGLEHGVFKMHHLVYGQPSCFPRLTELKTSYSVTWPERIAPLRSLRSLDLVAHKFACLLNALMSCPCLDTIAVDLGFIWEGEPPDIPVDQELLQRASRISTVRLKGVDVSHRKSVLKLFNNPHRPVYEVNMWPWASYRWSPGISFLTDVIFDIKYPTVVRFTLSDDVYSITCGDDAGKSRVLTFRSFDDTYVHARNLLLCIETADLRDASLPLTLWLELAHQFYLPCTLEVLELSLVANSLDVEIDFPLDMFGGIDLEPEMWGEGSAQLRQQVSQLDSGWDGLEISQTDEYTIRIKFSNPHGIERDGGIPPPIDQVLQYLSILALKPNPDLLHSRVVLDNEIAPQN